MANILKQLAKSDLVPLDLMIAASETDTVIKKIFWGSACILWTY